MGRRMIKHDDRSSGFLNKKEPKIPASGVDDKVVVITGSSSGIRESTAKLLARDGARVVLGARRKDRLDTVVKEIAAAGGKAMSLL